MTHPYDRWICWAGTFDTMTDQQARQCVEHFRLHPTELSHFMFNVERLSFDAFSNLIDVFKMNPYLERLSLYKCNIEKLHKIAELVETSSSLKRLICFLDEIDDESVTRMSEALRFSNLKRLYFGLSITFTSARIGSVLEGIRYNTSLSKLTLTCVPVGLNTEDREAIIETLRYNSTLTEINFSYHGVVSPVDSEITDMLAMNRRNKRLRETGLVWRLLESGVLADDA